MFSDNFFSLEKVIDRQPLSVPPNTPLREVVRQMQSWGNSCKLANEVEISTVPAIGNNSSCVLVVEDARLRGIFTERDLVKLIARDANIDRVTVAEVMSQNVVTLKTTDSPDAFAALNMLRENRIRHLPVVDGDDNILGLITAKNLRQQLEPLNLMKWRRVAEVMQTEVVCAAPEVSIVQIAKLMADKRVSCVAIVESGSDPNNSSANYPVGIITERDIVQYQNLSLDLAQPARNLMSAPLFLVSPEDTLWSVHQQMQQRRVRRLLVRSQNGELAGIITQTSLLRLFDPADMYGAIEILQRQVARLESEKIQLLEARQTELESEIHKQTAVLQYTNRKLQLEANLRRESEQRFNSILESLADLIWSVIPDTFKVIYINSAAEKIYGRPRSEFYNHAHLWLEIVHPADRDRVEALANSILETGGYEVEYRIIRPNGEIRWLYDRARLIRDPEGTPMRIDGIATDVSDRKQAELALKESQERYTLAVESSNIGIWDWNIFTGEVYLSSQWLAMLGYAEGELAGSVRTWETLIHPEDKPWIMELLNAHLQNDTPYEFDYRLRSKSGEWKWIGNYGKVVVRDDEGNPLRMTGVHKDISDRKQAELALRESQERFNLAVTGSRDGLWDWNVLTDEVFYAPRFKEMLGYLNAEMPNVFKSWSSKLHPDDRERVLAAVQNHLQDRVPYDVEYRLQTKEEGYRWFNARGQAIWDGNGRAIRMSGSITDIGDRKRREEILKDIASGMSIQIGENFWSSLVEYLSKTLKVDYAYVGTLVGTKRDRIVTQAVYDKGRVIDNFEYELAGTPCSHVIEQHFCIYPEAVQELFPNSLLLPEMSAESFAGMPIVDTDGRAIGLIAIVDSKPLDNISLIEEVLTIFVARVTTELERQQTEVNLQKSNRILQAISSIQTQFLTDANPGIMFDGMLEHLLELAQSEYGFIGEIFFAEDGSPIMEESYLKFRGRPFLKTHAITNIAWNEETRAFYAENAPKGMEFHNLETLFGAVIVTGEPVIANSPNTDPRRGGLPDGHPPLNAFLGVPFYRNDKMIGMAGIANRQEGYDDRLLEYLRPLLDTCSRVIEAYRSEQEKQQAEIKIREQAALLDVATDAIMVRGLDNKILFWNRGAEVLYGWSKAEILNRNSNEFFNLASSAKLTEIQQAVIADGEWQGELNQVTQAGQNITVESRWTLVSDEWENPEAYLVVNTDITEQKLLEAQFLRTQRLESLGTLAGGIAHDLNNILSPILGFSRLLPLKLPEVDEQTKGFFKIMETNAQRGSALVKQILTFSRGEIGDRGIVQIRHLIAEIEQIIRETFPKSIELEIDVPKNLWTVNADVNQLHQVLMNLAVNARDAMSDGGKLTIQAENTTVDREYARLHLDASEGSYVVITVSDTGVGIPPEIIDRIFEPFFTTKEIGRGTGLGLSTTIGIINSHGGFVNVDSKITDNSGTKVHVFLPISQDAVSVPEESAEIPLGNGELILVVDDEPSMLEVTKATLETYNYRVLTANNGIEAIATYVREQQAIELVIMDLMMPSMDGKTAIMTLKQIDPEVKIIAVSGLIAKEIAEEIDRHLAAFMAKPYTNEDLTLTVREAIDN